MAISKSLFAKNIAMMVKGKFYKNTPEMTKNQISYGKIQQRKKKTIRLKKICLYEKLTEISMQLMTIYSTHIERKGIIERYKICCQCIDVR